MKDDPIVFLMNQEGIAICELIYSTLLFLDYNCSLNMVQLYFFRRCQNGSGSCEDMTILEYFHWWQNRPPGEVKYLKDWHCAAESQTKNVRLSWLPGYPIGKLNHCMYASYHSLCTKCSNTLQILFSSYEAG